MNLDALRKLSQEASPSPWTLGVKVWRRKDGVELREVVAEHYIVSDWAPMPDAALIATLGSVRDELIAVAEAAKNYVTPTDGWKAVEAEQRVIDALAALEAKLGTEL